MPLKKRLKEAETAWEGVEPTWDVVEPTWDVVEEWPPIIDLWNEEPGEKKTLPSSQEVKES